MVCHCSFASQMASAEAKVEFNDEVNKSIRALDRPELLKLLDIKFDQPVIADIKDLRKISLYSTKQMTVHSDAVPFVNEGDATECYSGAYMRRFKHSTIVVPCFGVEFNADDVFCKHCAQMWAHADENDNYVLQKEMRDAYAVYKTGSKRMLKNWPGMMEIGAKFDETVQGFKETCAELPCKLERTWPGMKFEQVIKLILTDSGILFKDAARSRHPHARAEQEQREICSFTLEMMQKWLRIRTTIAQRELQPFLDQLRGWASLIAQASTWVLQAQYPDYPVFYGPIVAADVWLAAFHHAANRFDVLMAHGMDPDTEDKQFSGFADFSWGPKVHKLAEWATTVSKVTRPPVPKIVDSSSTPAPTRVNKTPRSSESSVDIDLEHEKHGKRQSKWWYGVMRGVKPGVYDKWDGPGGANEQVLGFSNPRVKKFRSAKLAQR